jgi:hypothetical protein
MTPSSNRQPTLRPVAEDETTVPWDRQDGESARAYAAFVAYRDMGPARSLRKLAVTDVETSSNVRQLARWSAQWDWPDRAVAYDGHQDREHRLEQAEARKRMLRTHAAVASAGVARAAERIRNLDPNTLSPREAVALFEVSVRIERLSRGQTDGGDVESLTTIRPVPSGGILLAALKANPRLLELADAVADVVDIMDHTHAESSSAP